MFLDMALKVLGWKGLSRVKKYCPIWVFFVTR
jgi:hypothetical protein